MKFSRDENQNRFTELMTSAIFCRGHQLFCVLRGMDMLFSLSLILLFGAALGALAEKLHLPQLVGMMLTGLLLGPGVANLLQEPLLAVSADLRKLALIVILMKAGLSLDFNDLRKVGRPALLLSFLPASCEIAAYFLFAPALLSISRAEAALLGAVLAAVSPAVVVPRMVNLMEKGLGVKKGIPQMILAGASMDDIFVIVLFSAFCGVVQGGAMGGTALLGVPVSILNGILVGACAGLAFHFLFLKVHMRDTSKVVLLLGAALLFASAEQMVPVPFSGLLAVMACGMVLCARRSEVARRLSAKFSKLWVAAQILLFVLVGAAVQPQYAAKAGLAVVGMLAIGLVFRSLGVLLCVVGGGLTPKEKLFCAIAYLPKATVQAAIGSVPLSLGLSCGPLVLTAAVLSIFITAPLGAAAIDRFSLALLMEK